ncbi:hypothetical protein MKAN_22805 [Mycobacterium kansasii ATCC 12478]|uniref:Uncharacterized protein n=1 Tax=Mycobacterium kansasii ATCC 12478 TaxID=557599 RepID=U5WZM7_MYCKA|nr:hypothetical protein MKAN_22805 [Mycobacterium kansasii ATCC 12478]
MFWHRPAQRLAHVGRVNPGAHRPPVEGFEECFCVLRGGVQGGSAIGHGLQH